MRFGWALLGASVVALSCGSSGPSRARHEDTTGGAAGDGTSGGESGASGGATGGAATGASGGAGADPNAAGSSESAGGTRDGLAGEAGAGGAAGESAGASASAPCTFDVTATTSAAIPTVGIVTWSVNMAAVERASIEFGLDESYGFSAPVDLDAPGRRTLLLGMKAAHDYHYRVVADGGGEHCVSPDYVLTTGPLANGLPVVEVKTEDAERATPGFIESVYLVDGPAFIIDQDGDYVWWSGSGEMGRAEQSYDGKYMWIGNVNVSGGAGRVHRVGMDGTGDTDFPEFGDYSHDLTVLPDETVGFIQHDGHMCDDIMERAPDGSVREIINVHDAHGGTAICHTNSIHYHADDDSYTFSDLNQNTYVKVTRAGEVVWILGGTTSQFTGDGAEWTREHGHELIAPDRLLFFNNNEGSQSSLAVEVKLDFDAMTATRVFQYDGGFSSVIYGDVQRLDDGNTLVTYSVAGVVHEIGPDGALVRSFETPVGGAFGYATFRTSLYGPPPER